LNEVGTAQDRALGGWSNKEADGSWRHHPAITALGGHVLPCVRAKHYRLTSSGGGSRA